MQVRVIANTTAPSGTLTCHKNTRTHLGHNVFITVPVSSNLSSVKGSSRYDLRIAIGVKVMDRVRIFTKLTQARRRQRATILIIRTL